MPTLGNYSRGANVPEGENRGKVQRLLGLSDADFMPDSLETSDGKMEVRRVAKTGRRVPIVSWALAGSMEGRGAFEDLANQIGEDVETTSRDPHAFAIEVSGDSMEPLAPNRAIVVFEPTMEPSNGMPVLVKLIDGRVFFKRLYRTGEKIILQSENDSYADLEFTHTEIAWIYPAKDIVTVANTRPRRI